MSVVAGVFVDPPAVAQAYRQVGEQYADRVVRAARAEDLPMSGVVTQETEISFIDDAEAI